MSWISLLNNEEYTFTRDDLPALIHGQKGSGSSFFSLSLLSQLFRQGEPLFMVTASLDAKEEFLNQTNAGEGMVTITTEEDLAKAEGAQVIHMLNQDEALINKVFFNLSDYTERIVFLKNIESLSKEVLSLFYPHSATIFTGDLNTCAEKEALLQLKYNAKIFFSPLENDFRLTLPPLEQYHGYYQGRINQGTVYLEERI